MPAERRAYSKFMTKTNSFLLLMIILILLSLTAATAYSQNTEIESLERNKARLEELYQKWLWLDREYAVLLDKELKQRVDNSKRGEFETSKQFENRTEKAARLEEEIERETRVKIAREKQILNREISKIMAMQFTLPVPVKLGIYDADRQRFPLQIYRSEEQKEITIPLADAPNFKTNAKNHKYSGTFSIFLDGKGSAREYLQKLRVEAGSRSFSIDQPQISVERAMQVLFGSFNSGIRRSSWYPITGARETKEYFEKTPVIVSVIESEFDRQRIYSFSRPLTHAAPIFSKSYVENGVSKFIVAAASLKAPDDGGQPEFGSVGCHSCGLPVGIVIFERRDGTWQVEAINRNVGTYGGQWGMEPPIGFVKIGRDKNAILLQDYWFGQGTTTTHYNYITNINGSIDEVLGFEQENDSTARGELDEYSVAIKARVEYLPNANSEYFDIRVSTSGKKGQKAGRRFLWKPFSKVEIFQFDSDSYKSKKSPAGIK